MACISCQRGDNCVQPYDSHTVVLDDPGATEIVYMSICDDGKIGPEINELYKIVVKHLVYRVTTVVLSNADMRRIHLNAVNHAKRTMNMHEMIMVGLGSIRKEFLSDDHSMVMFTRPTLQRVLSFVRCVQALKDASVAMREDVEEEESKQQAEEGADVVEESEQLNRYSLDDIRRLAVPMPILGIMKQPDGSYVGHENNYLFTSY
jgi:hypothetical protein